MQLQKEVKSNPKQPSYKRMYGTDEGHCEKRYEIQECEFLVRCRFSPISTFSIPLYMPMLSSWTYLPTPFCPIHLFSQ